MSDAAGPDVLGRTAQIVAAHIGNNQVAAEALPSLIQTVYRSLAAAGNVEAAPAMQMTCRTFFPLLLSSLAIWSVLALLTLLAFLKNERGEYRAVRINPEEVGFHIAEFNSLKTEAAGLVQASSDNFRNAVLASAGVFAWVITATPREPLESFIPHALWLPFWLSGLLLTISARMYIRARDIGIYLRRLEGTLGSERLGWEKVLAARTVSLSRAYIYGWAILVTGDLVLAVYTSNSVSGCIKMS